MTRLEHAAVEGRRLDPPVGHVALLAPRQRQAQHAVGQLPLHQVLQGPAERMVVGQAPEADVGQPIGAVPQQRLDAAVAFFLVLAQDKTGEQLREGVVLSAALRGAVG